MGASRSEGGAPLVVSVVAGLLVAAAALLAGFLLRANEAHHLDDDVRSTLTRVTRQIGSGLERDLRALERFAARQERRGAMPDREWEAQASALRADLPDLETLEWVDASFRVRRVVPPEDPEGVLGRDLGAEPRCRTALEAARREHAASVSPPLVLARGGSGFRVVVPVGSAERFEGFVVGLYRIGALLDAIVDAVATDYDVRIASQGTLLHAHAVAGAEPARARSASVRLRNAEWTVTVAPGPAVVAEATTWLPLSVPAGGLVTAVFFAYVVFVARGRRRRTLELKDANARLRDEMEARREAEAELGRVLHALPDHVWSAHVSPERAFQPRYFSSRIGDITGQSPERYRANPQLWIDGVHPEDRERVARAYADAVGGLRRETAMEYRIQRDSGEVRWVSDRILVTPLDEGRRLVGVISDITAARRAEEERSHLQAQLLERERLESLGVLAGGIAHDFNNLLVAVLGHAHLVLGALPADAPARKNLAAIEKAARRAGELCRQMLAYAGKGPVARRPLHLGEAVMEMGELLAASIPKKASLHYEIDPDLPAIEGDAAQIRQVVLNLITNAAEALGPEGGRIVVSARERAFDRATLARAELGDDLAPGPWVALSVRDDGVGMDAEARRHLFEPFYSTKFAGRGLGLASVLGIVRSHRGAILVDSAPERGTCVTVLLPQARGDEEPASPAPAPAPARTGGREATVLLVDDEPDAREVASLMLQRVGFRVLTAEDGEEALATLDVRGDDVDLVLLDLTMPRLDGVETLQRIRERGLRIPVVLCSGYSEQDTLERFAGLGLEGFLEKPYTPEALRAAVEQGLRSAG